MSIKNLIRLDYNRVKANSNPNLLLPDNLPVQILKWQTACKHELASFTIFPIDTFACALAKAF